MSDNFQKNEEERGQMNSPEKNCTLICLNSRQDGRVTKKKKRQDGR